MVTQEWLRQKAENVKPYSYLGSILPELVEIIGIHGAWDHRG